MCVCVRVELGKKSGQDILRQRNIGKELRGEAVMKKLVGNMVGAKGGQNWPSETFTTDTEASIHATKVLEDKHTSPPRQVCTQTKPHDLMMDEIPGSITETVPRQSRFSRAANGKPGTFCVDSETLNKFVSVRTVTRSLSTEFKQNLNKEESKPWKKTNISYFSL